MEKFKKTFILFGLWIGLLLAGCGIIELYLEGQIYSHRTFSVIAILFTSGIISSALSWRFFSRFGRSTIATSLILSLSTIILFFLMGTLVSYAVIVMPHFFEPDQDHGSPSIASILEGIVLGILGSGFSFKTFGLPLLWPLGLISGLIGTFGFVTLNNFMKSGPHH